MEIFEPMLIFLALIIHEPSLIGTFGHIFQLQHIPDNKIRLTFTDNLRYQLILLHKYSQIIKYIIEGSYRTHRQQIKIIAVYQKQCWR